MRRYCPECKTRGTLNLQRLMRKTPGDEIKSIYLVVTRGPNVPRIICNSLMSRAEKPSPCCCMYLHGVLGWDFSICGGFRIKLFECTGAEFEIRIEIGDFVKREIEYAREKITPTTTVFFYTSKVDGCSSSRVLFPTKKKCFVNWFIRSIRATSEQLRSVVTGNPYSFHAVTSGMSTKTPTTPIKSFFRIFSSLVDVIILSTACLKLKCTFQVVSNYEY